MPGVVQSVKFAVFRNTASRGWFFCFAPLSLSPSSPFVNITLVELKVSRNEKENFTAKHSSGTRPIYAFIYV